MRGTLVAASDGVCIADIAAAAHLRLRLRVIIDIKPIADLLSVRWAGDLPAICP